MRFSIFLLLILFLGLACKKRESKEFRELPLNTIVVLGSSTAAGAGATSKDSSWVNLLTDDMRNSKIEVINLAVSGYTTFHVIPNDSTPPAGRPKTDSEHNIIAAMKNDPRLVILSFPTNDIANGFDDNEIMANYEVLTHIIGSYGASFMIISTFPRALSVDKRRRLKSFNDLLKLKYGSKVIDIFDSLSTSDNFIRPELSFGDGIHFNNKGHKVIYKGVRFSNVFMSYLNFSSRYFNVG